MDGRGFVLVAGVFSSILGVFLAFLGSKLQSFLISGLGIGLLLVYDSLIKNEVFQRKKKK